MQESRKVRYRDLLGKIASCEHVVQIYEDKGCFLSTLEEFIIIGLEAPEGVILIAT